MSRQLTSLLLAISVFLGVALPEIARLAKPLLMPSIFVIMVVALTTIDVTSIRGALRRTRTLFGVCAWQLAAFPLVAALACALLPVPDGIRVAMIASACAGPIFSSPAFARMFGLDDAFMTAVVVMTTILMPLPLLGYSYLLLGVRLELDVGEFLWRLLVFIVLPFAIATAIRRCLEPADLIRATPLLAWIVLGGLAVFALAVMDGVTARFLEAPALVVGFLVAAFTLNVTSQMITAGVFWWAGPSIAWTAALAAGYRNMALVLALSGGILGSDFQIYVGIAQIPMYVLPLVLTPLYRRLVPN